MMQGVYNVKRFNYYAVSLGTKIIKRKQVCDEIP